MESSVDIAIVLREILLKKIVVYWLGDELSLPALCNSLRRRHLKSFVDVEMRRFY